MAAVSTENQDGTLTLKLPEDVAERLSIIPLLERERFLIAAIQAAVDEWEETITGIERGMEDYAKGQESSLEDAREHTRAELDARISARNAHRTNGVASS